MSRPELIIAPAEKGDWGVVSKTSGPSDPPGIPAKQLQGVNALLREGMIALTRTQPRDLDRAERCFRQALDALYDLIEEGGAKVSFALDRIGLVCHLRGQEDLAERFYLQSIECLDRGEWPPSAWNEVTFLNLAILYGSHGREDEQAQAMSRLHEIQDQADES